MRRLMLTAAVCVLIAGAAYAQCTLEETSVMGEPAVVLENEFVRLRVRPTVGGRIDQLVYKVSDTSLTSQDDGVVFADRIWNYASSDVYLQWIKGAYTYVTDSTPERVAITLTGPGFVGPGRFMSFEKTFSLSAGSSAVRADYRFHVAQEAMSPQRVGLWWHNRLGVPQEANTYYTPTEQGVRTASYGAGGGGQYWWYEPSRGWTAVVGEGGTGVAATMDLGPLMLMYNYMGGDVASLEWAFRSEEIANGSSTQTTAWLLPFAGMSTIAGASAEVVVGLGETAKELAAPGDVPVTVQLSAPKPLAVSVTLTAKRLPDGAAQEVAEFTAELKPGETDAREVTVTLAQPGTWVLEGTVNSGGESVADFFHEVVIGERSGQIAIEPNVERIGRVGERFEDKIAAKGTGPEDRRPSHEIVTPHIKWANPLQGGPLRALIVTDLLNGREIVELAQRLELDYDAPTISGAYSIGQAGGMFEADVNTDWAIDNLRDLLDANTYDVILMGGLSGELFPPDVTISILDQVRGGAGLVWVNPNHLPEDVWQALPVGDMASLSRPPQSWQPVAEHFITAGIPWEALPPTEVCRYTESDGAEVLARGGEYALVAANSLGDGRIVTLGYNASWQGPGAYSNGITPWIQFAPVRFDYWEYYHGLLAKSMIWAADRVPEAHLSSMGVEPAGATQGADAPVLQMSFSSAPQGSVADLRLRDEFGEVRQSEELPATAAQLSWTLPGDLPGGRYLVDAIVRNADGATVDWGSATFTVTPRVEVTELTVPDEIFRGGQDVTATAMLTAIQPAPGQVELVASITDSRGRVVARQSQQVNSSGETTVAVPLPEPLTTLAALRVEVRDGETLLDAAETDVLTMPKAWDDREWEPWLSLMWGSPAGAYSREYLSAIGTRRLEEMGVDGTISSSSWLHDGEQLNNFVHGFRTVPLNIAGDILHTDNVRGEGMLKFSEAHELYAKTGDKQYLHRPWPLQAEATLDHMRERIPQICDATSRYRPVGYSCGDELSVTHYVTPFDYDFSPSSLEHFRLWLEEQYGTLAALNAQWETDFATWDDVMPMTTEEVRGRGNYSPWADHRTFMEVSYAGFLGFVDGLLEAEDPGARIGISGTQSAEAYGGYDWWRLTDVLDFAQTYDHKNTGIMHRSFNEMLTAPWWGYMQREPAMGHRLWWRLLNDNDGGSYYTWSYVYWPDLTWTASTADALPHWQEIRGGIARLINECDERPADIWVHYSHPSIHGTWITGGQSLFSDNRGGWISAIEDLGMQVRFIAYAEIERGDLTEQMPPALLLPYSVALSDREAEEIEAYVRAGGTVIADARIGLMDEHCRVRESGVLDGLFGVSRTVIDPSARRPEGTVSFDRAMEGCDPTGISYEDIAGEELALTTGQRLGTIEGRPVMIANSAGRGRTVLLNLFFDSYERRRGLGVSEPMLKTVEESLKLAGIEGPIDVETEGGHSVYVARYQDGETTFVGVVRDTVEGGDRVTVDFGEAAQVYDVREGQSLGRLSEVTASMAPGECIIYALLPYEVSGVRVRPREETVARGDEVDYLVSVDANGEPGMHVYRIEVTDPAGNACAWYSTQLTAERGSASGGFRTALNDAPGRWTIRATDIATGVSGEASVTVE